jgi:fatty-acyl-CoA synthase
MFHVHAWGIPYMATLMGVKQVYPGRYEPAVLVGLRVKEKVTFSHCVPTILHMILSHPAAQSADFSGWKLIIGGSALNKALCKTAMEKGIDVFTGYGMSETCPILTLAQLTPEMLAWEPEATVEIRCKTGRPLPLVDLRIVDEAMGDAPHDGKSTGEIVVRAPWLTQGYLKDTATSLHLWAGGYLHTSDVANIDGRGFVQICDRIKDVIKTGGEWISSLELEDILLQHPAVMEAAVIAHADEKWGERPMALIVLKPGEADTVTDAVLKAHVKEYADKGVISKFGVPDRVLFVDAIEKTSVGKLNKKFLREKYAK